MALTETKERHALCLCCFGRGGSSLLWHLLGSSPDIWMMQKEWHQTVFGARQTLRRVLRKATRSGMLHNLADGERPHDRMLQRFVRRRIHNDLAQDTGLYHPQAALICMKVMDYNIVWTNGIQNSFDGGKTVVLLRHPQPQCESLMRSGLTLEAACDKYNDVATHMARLISRTGVVVVRFEEFLADPEAVMTRTYAALGARAPDKYTAKVKPYGDKRQATTDVSTRKLRTIARDELRGFVDPDVDKNGIARLSALQAETIWGLTSATAECLGYRDAAPSRSPVDAA